MPRKVTDISAVVAAVHALDAGVIPARAQLQRAVLHTLGDLADRAPGRSIEVRIPPFGAIQCGQAPDDGPTHRRGTPPNVIETDAATWLKLAAARLSWAAAVSAGDVSASGVRADLSRWLPLLEVPFAE